MKINLMNKTKSGFTLAEMMIVLGAFSIIMGIVYASLRSNDIYSGLIRIKVELYRQNKRVISLISDELKKSNLTGVNIQDGAGINGSDIIIFQVPIGLDNNYNVIWGAGGTAGRYIRYELDGTGEFFLREELDAAMVIVSQQEKAYKIIDLQFADNSLDGTVPACSVRIIVTAEKQTPDRHDISLSSTALVYLEN